MSALIQQKSFTVRYQDSIFGPTLAIVERKTRVSPVLGFSWWRGDRLEQTIEMAELIFINETWHDPFRDIDDRGTFQFKGYKTRFRHGFHYRIGDQESAKYWFAVGGGYSLFYQALKTTAQNIHFWPTQSKESGIAIDVNPSLHFLLKKRLRLEVSAPITISTFSYDWSKTSNPNLTPAQQTLNNYELDFRIRNAVARVGLVFKI